MANYNSVSAIDTDDGSAYLHAHHNFFAYGAWGLKCDFGGHDNMWDHNIIAYTSSCWSLEGYFKFYNMGFSNNTCIVSGASVGYQSTGGVSNRAPPGHNNCGTATCCPRCCGGVDKSFTSQIGDNKVFSSDGGMKVCSLSFTDWQKAGNDVGSTISKWPKDADLISQVHSLLGSAL